jgi:Mrp family chromosome partitioning ATPase
MNSIRARVAVMLVSSVLSVVVLSTLVEGVILVVHGGKSTRAITQRAKQELVNVGAKVFGVVLNNVDLRGDGYYEYYNKKYSENGRNSTNASAMS